jgi:hypothetical protein
MSYVPVYAADFTSASFMAKNPLTDLFGGYGSSTSFFSFLAGGQTVTGEASSTNFAVAAGFMYFDSFAPESHTWRWYSDYAHETPTSALASEDVAPADINNGDTLKLRLTVKETADIGESGTKFALQYSTSSDFSTGAVTLAEQGSCNGSSVWCYADGGGSDNGTITTAVISDADSCSGGVGQGCGTHNESGTSISSFTHQKSASTEYEFTVQQSGATANTAYFFRLFDTTASSSVPLASGASYPSVLTGGTSLDVSIGGVASSTTIAGVTTSVDTTPLSVGFGHIPAGTPVTGAQQLTVSTNAGSGYRIFAFQRQALLSDAGSAIAPVAGTNASPTSWTSGCATLASCYGYHTDASVLSGGSTRFAADDTYAQLDTTPGEIAYSAGPASSATTSLVYRLQATGLQDAGSYSSNVVYIVVPVF